MQNLHFADRIEQIDFEKATELLAREHWCKGITQNEVRYAAKHSALVVGAYLDSTLVGYLRVVSDQVCFAYIMDVVVEENRRKQGIGQSMVRFTLDHKKLRLVYQWMLRTPDAQGVYEKVGFRPIVNSSQWMLIQENRPCRNTFDSS
ncbi:GNAT family N-acetyltransferase [bacterium]|nr:GNAT family N-acetyltransferase [bacterium]